MDELPTPPGGVTDEATFADGLLAGQDSQINLALHRSAPRPSALVAAVTEREDLLPAFVRALLRPSWKAIRWDPVPNTLYEPEAIKAMLSCAMLSSHLAPDANTQHGFAEVFRKVAAEAPRKVCQHVFKRNDIVWICRTCQTDETCVVCNDCFRDSKHDGHDVFFYHAQAGGCCDCGDPGAWARGGFCTKHGRVRERPVDDLPPRLVGASRAVLGEVITSLLAIVDASRRAYEPAPAPVTGPAAAADTAAASADAAAAAATASAAAGAHAELASASAAAALAAPTPQSLLAAIEANTHAAGLVAAAAAATSMAADSTGASSSAWGPMRVPCPPTPLDEGEDGGLQGGEYPGGAASAPTTLVLHVTDVQTEAQITEVLRLVRMEFPDTDLADEKASKSRVYVGKGSPHATLGGPAALLAKNSFLVSRRSNRLLVCELRAAAAVSWLHELSVTCDGMCRLVAECFTLDVLAKFMRGDLWLDTKLADGLHSLFLTLMADETFKRTIAKAYAVVYQELVPVFARGVGQAEHALFCLSVQFLNRATFVTDLVDNHGLLPSLARSLRATLELAKADYPQTAYSVLTGAPTHALAHNHLVFVHRRYAPVISDLKCVLNVDGMAARYMVETFDDTLAALTLIQGIDPQKRRARGSHVEYELRHWMHAFNIDISFSSVFENLSQCLPQMADGCRIERPDGLPPIDRSGGDLVGALLDRVVAAVSEWHRGQRDAHASSPPLVGFLPDALGGPLSLFAPPGRSSFHLSLHRFLASLVAAACSSARLLPAVDFIARALANSHHVSESLLAYPVSTVAMACQIRCGMWRRNGQGMNDQVMNYSEAPFVRMFRDLDLAAVQLGMLALGAHRTLSELVVRLGLCRWLCAAGDDDAAASGFEDAADDEFAVPLAEHLLRVVAILVTEVPRPPQPHDAGGVANMLAKLRREMVHRLAAGPCTHSELHESIQLVPKGDALSSSSVEDLVSSLSEAVPAGPLEAHKLKLKETCWTEYDPCFYHLSLQNHQTAQAQQPPPQAQTPRPLVRAAPEAHPTFAPLRPQVFFACPMFLAVVRRVFRAALLTGDSVCSEVLLLRAVHLCTLAVHTARAGADPARDVALLFGPRADGDGNDNDNDDAPSALVDMIIAVEAKSVLAKDPVVKSGLAWVLSAVAEAAPAACGAAVAESRAATGVDAAGEQDKRRKLARERAMAAMQKNAAAFSHFAMGDDDMSESESEDEYGAPAAADAADAADAAAAAESEPECMVCRERIAGVAVGHVGYAERCGVRTRPWPRNTEAPWAEESCALHVSLCGHAIHYSCFDSYFRSVQASGLSALALDVRGGEFFCPLCKSLSSIIVPHCRAPEAPEEGEGDEGDMADEAAADTGDDAAAAAWWRSLEGLGEAAAAPRRPREGASSDAAVGERDGTAAVRRYERWLLHRSGEDGDSFGNADPVERWWRQARSFAYTASSASLEAPESGLDESDARHLAILGRTLLAAALHPVLLPRIRKDVLRALFPAHEAPGGGETGGGRFRDVGNGPGGALLRRNVLEVLVGAACALGPAEIATSGFLRCLSRARRLQAGSAGGDSAGGGAALEAAFSRAARAALDALGVPEAAAAVPLDAEDPWLQGGPLEGTVKAWVDDAEEETAMTDRRVLALVEAAAKGGVLAEEARNEQAGREAAVALSTPSGQPVPQAFTGAAAMSDTGDEADGSDRASSTDRLAQLQAELRSIGTARSVLERHEARRRAPDYPGLTAGCGGSGAECDCRERFAAALPAEYTDLHASLSKITGAVSDHPALCLVCGAISCGAGGGQCTQHAVDKHAGNSIFFLLHECTVLLVHGQRASYFASPYIDSFGERHGQSRGRPLHLAAERIEAVRKLWAAKKLAKEVARARSSDRHVIQMGFY